MNNRLIYIYKVFKKCIRILIPSIILSILNFCILFSFIIISKSTKDILKFNPFVLNDSPGTLIKPILSIK